MGTARSKGWPDELGISGVFGLVLFAIIFLPAVIFTVYFSRRPKETNLLGAAAGALNILFVVVVFVQITFYYTVPGWTLLIWESGVVLALLGVGQAAFVGDESSADAEAEGWQRWLWSTKRPWTTESPASDDERGAADRQWYGRAATAGDGGTRAGATARGRGTGKRKGESRRQRAGRDTGGRGRRRTGRRSGSDGRTRSTRGGTGDRAAGTDGAESDDDAGRSRSDDGRRHRSVHGDDSVTRAARAAEILGVDPDASSETVEGAYRERVKETHPDAGGSTEEFIAVKEAYRILSGDET